MTLGQVIYIWRSHRKMTQTELAQRSGVSRPNLSTLEQGGRDVTVATLRRIADALSVKPGTLIDDVLPDERELNQDWTREKLDRIAKWVSGVKVPLSKEERKFAIILKTLVKRKIGQKGAIHSRTSRDENIKWILLKQQFGERSVTNLLSRIDKLK